MKNPRPEEKTIVKDIRNLFRLEKETKVVKDRILRDAKNLFELEEENYYKLVGVNNFGVTTVIDIKHYQLKNILIKLDHV